MSILNIAGYHFVTLTDVETLQKSFRHICQCADLKGTVLISEEGINLSLAGKVKNISLFKKFLTEDDRFAAMTFRESYSQSQPFKRLKIKLKKEIITLRQPTIKPSEKKAPSISPLEFKQWLDENRDLTILDTRNDYEIEFGHFKNAVNLNIKHFCDFPNATSKVPNDQPIVMYCTGGVRCEKAALYLLEKGYKEVYQLEGGILNYFNQIGAAHYQGDCYVFDERIAVTPTLQKSNRIQCEKCSQPVIVNQENNVVVWCDTCTTL